MIDLLKLHKHFILTHLHEGDVAVDFTMGNGYDTEFLSKTVGENGRVYAFDIQEQAVESTRRHLQEVGCPENYILIHDSHHNVKNYVKEPIKAGMFNLGYLPGSGNKALTTSRSTTLPAVADAVELLDVNGVLLVAVYPGHPEGASEGRELTEYFGTLSRFKFTVTQIRIVNSPDSPFFTVIERAK